MNAAQSCPLCATDELRAQQHEQAIARGLVGRMVWCSFCRAPLGVALSLPTTPEPDWYRLLERVP